jgi:hypothetical protein
MNESIDSDELSDLLNILMNLSPSPLSIVARDLRPIEGLALRDELRLAGRNEGHHGSSRAGGVGGRIVSRRSQGSMMGDIIRARSRGVKYHPIAGPAVARADHPAVDCGAASPAVNSVPRAAACPAVARSNHSVAGYAVVRANHTFASAVIGPAAHAVTGPAFACAASSSAGQDFHREDRIDKRGGMARDDGRSGEGWTLVSRSARPPVGWRLRDTRNWI